MKIRSKWLDNRWVVPYNPILLTRYNYHINVEVCSSIKCAKYLYTYVFKGHDRVSASINQARANMDGQPLVINEIKQYRDGRCITAIEAIYRLYGFPLYDMSPSVLQMQVHLPGKHMVAYKARDDLNNVVQNPNSQRSVLTEYFSTNMYNLDAQNIYIESSLSTSLG